MRRTRVTEPRPYGSRCLLPDPLLLFPYSWRWPRDHREELDEAFLAVGRARTLLGFEHGLRERIELLAQITIAFHPAAFGDRALDAMIVVGEGHVNRQSQQLLNL